MLIVFCASKIFYVMEAGKCPANYWRQAFFYLYNHFTKAFRIKCHIVYCYCFLYLGAERKHSDKGNDGENAECSQGKD